jgi:nucleolar pre-ribosomal-associated protein 1
VYARKRNETVHSISLPSLQMLLIFQVFEAILLRTASDLSHFHVVGTNIVKKLVNNHMKLICESLYASGYR